MAMFLLDFAMLSAEIRTIMKLDSYRGVFQSLLQCDQAKTGVNDMAR
jgi:hypothetical protein